MLEHYLYSEHLIGFFHEEILPPEHKRERDKSRFLTLMRNDRVVCKSEVTAESVEVRGLLFRVHFYQDLTEVVRVIAEGWPALS